MGRTPGKGKEREQVDSVLVGDMDVSRAWKEAKEEDRKAKDRRRIEELEEEVKRLRDEVRFPNCDVVATLARMLIPLNCSSLREKRTTEGRSLEPALLLHSSARRSSPHLLLLLLLRRPHLPLLPLSGSSPTGRMAVLAQYFPMLVPLSGSVYTLPSQSSN